MPILEVCCDSIDSVAAAMRGFSQQCPGAGRIELCSALSEGGLTPSSALQEAVVRMARGRHVPIFVLIRPRGGDFCFSDDEHQIMLRDISLAAGVGASGVVIGSLSTDGDIDIMKTRELAQAATDHGLEVTFHRACDIAKDPIAVGIPRSRLRLNARTPLACGQCAHFRIPLLINRQVKDRQR